MKKYIAILFIGLSVITKAQNKISGIVTNLQNEPLIGVEIYAEDLNKGTSTNEEGYYELT
ncbi:MAG TPA: hypothetical protein ENK75_05435, partial [Saprospiraceae bacterium]|nr:hypothetical protein [Saprospiraceae bacterium]